MLPEEESMSERNHETSAVWHKVDVIKPGSMENIVALSTHNTLTFFTAEAVCRRFCKHRMTSIQ